MYRFAFVVLVGCAADPTGEPTATSHVDFKDVPAFGTLHHADVVFVFDDTAPMAALEDQVRAKLPQLADAIDANNTQLDVRVSAITTSSATVRGTFELVDLPTGGNRTSFTGAIADQILALAPTSFTGTANQPLAQIATALEHGNLHREGARLFIIPITSRDDESPDAVASYFTRVTAVMNEPVIQPIAPTAPRLTEFAQRPSIAIEDPDWSPAMVELGRWLSSLVGPPCFESVLVEPYECAFTAVYEPQQQSLPACDEGKTNRPCVTFRVDVGNCTTGQHLTYDVSWAEWPELGTHVTSQCVIDSSSI